VGDDIARNRLLFEPLAGVAFDGSGAVRQFGRRQRSLVGQRAVPAESVAEIDRLHLCGAAHCVEYLLGELVGLQDGVRRGNRGHGVSYRRG
jgi:hypothetical protein